MHLLRNHIYILHRNNGWIAFVEYKAFFSNNYEAKIPKEAKVNLKRLGLEEKKCGELNKGLFEVDIESIMSCKQLVIFFQILHVNPVNILVSVLSPDDLGVASRILVLEVHGLN